MYRPKIFSEDRLDLLHEFIRSYPLGLIISAGTGEIMANLIPVSLHAVGEKGTIRLHLAKMNSQISSLRDSSEVLVVFNGPNTYVSPAWYPTKKQDGKVVPTWNYSMVQARGKPVVVDDPMWILQQIKDLTTAMEATRENPWKVSDAPEGYILSQMKAIVGVEIAIDRIEGKFKVSQNQTEANREGVKNGLLDSAQTAMWELVANKGPSKQSKSGDQG